MANYSDNCFFFLGKTGVGKSLCAKILTENKSIIVSNDTESCTYNVSGYDSFIPSSFFLKELYYKVIDTPGLLDSKGRDNNIIDKIKKYMTDKNCKVKGIFIFLNFRNIKFDVAEKDIIKKIYNLIPMDNFWKYVTIIFTNYFADKFENLEEMRKEREKSFRKSFEELINSAYEKEAIIKISTSDLRIEYIDFYDPDRYNDPIIKDRAKKENKIHLDKLKKIFRVLTNYEPLYSKIEEEIVDNQKVIEKVSGNKAKLYNCKIQKFFYYNQEGKIIKVKGKILEQKKEKDIELDRLKDHSFRAFVTQIGAYVASAACYIGSAVFPPAAPALITAGGLLSTVSISAGAVGLGTKISDSIESNTYYNTDDISNYEK